ncbi:MAG: NAD-dependent epimerase/dehydratase family protein, partial [Acidimicrobiia bacterium]
MLRDEKILITGAAGQIAFPITEMLAADNEVWGIARFGDPATRAKVDALGVTTRSIDLDSGEFGDLPSDFTYVLHLAAFMGGGLDYDHALRVNAEGTGLLLQHCRTAKAALVMSTHSVYKPVADPMHAFLETDPLGDVNATHAPTYSISKISQEAVARYCARAFDLPVIIARMNASYGNNGGLPAYHLDTVVAGQPVITRNDPMPYSLIHQDDINTQTEALLDAASVPGTVVNWAGDEAIRVLVWCRYAGELCGMVATVLALSFPGTLIGSIADNAKRL